MLFIYHSIELINLTNQADMDILTTVMEEFVEVFSKELSPFAIQLCEQLVFIFDVFYMICFYCIPAMAEYFFSRSVMHICALSSRFLKIAMKTF